MQDTQETFTQKLIRYYGDRLVDPDMYPHTFNHQVKVYAYINKNRGEDEIHI